MFSEAFFITFTSGHGFLKPASGDGWVGQETSALDFSSQSFPLGNIIIQKKMQW